MSSLVGRPGGQHLDLAKAIRNLLGLMGQNIPIGMALVKELMQNADDAGAGELHLYLDERRPPQDLVRELEGRGYGRLAKALLTPALVVRNDAPFRKPEDNPGPNRKDDFKALCEVAEGHKVDEAVSAGRFGIGFNSVYFVTDTPLIYSRRDIHLFDPCKVARDEGGWYFPLEELRTSTSETSTQLALLSWCFPELIMGRYARSRTPFGERDCQEAYFRLPLRTTVETLSATEGNRQEPLYAETFAKPALRRELAATMIQTAAESIIFLKTLRLVDLWKIPSGADEAIRLAHVEVACEPQDPTASFLEEVEKVARKWQESERTHTLIETRPFRRSVKTTVEPGSHVPEAANSHRTFWIQHRACFDNQKLHKLGRDLYRNRERGVPWVAAAVPADADSFLSAESTNPSWRVFLPLTEEGPCAALLHAACFVDPSRKGLEFSSSGSDTARRKTLWNQELIHHGLAPLLREFYPAMAERLKDLCQEEPELYLSLIPPIPAKGKTDATPAAHLRRSYHDLAARVRVFDLWGAALNLAPGSHAKAILLERVPDWVAAYEREFRVLSRDRRRYVSDRLGRALEKALQCEVSNGPRWFTARAILRAKNAPRVRDLVPLLDAAVSLDAENLAGCWALLTAEEGKPLRYAAEAIYLLTPGEEPMPPVLDAVLMAGKSFSSGVVFVRAGAGLDDPKLRESIKVSNLHRADKAVFEGLQKIKGAGDHNSCHSLLAAGPVVDFMVQQTPTNVPESLRLAWLVRTAGGQEGLTNTGLVMVRPAKEDTAAHVLWQGFVRETFPEVDPEASRAFVARLLEAGFGRFLTSADGVQVEVPTAGKVLPLLFQAIGREPGLLQRMEAALNRSVSADGKIRPEALQASSLLLEEADRRWDNLSEQERQLILQLPIHRNSRDRLIALQTGLVEDWRKALSARYRLQGDGRDLRDAPVDLPDNVVLLHSQDKSTFEFYRQRLGLGLHGRVQILKDCLVQIGGGGSEDSKLLRYLCGYLKQQLDELAESSDPADRQDRDELQQLLEEARVVPTVTGSWCRLQEAVDPSDCRRRLEKAGYQGRKLDDLLAGLFHPRAVADAVQARDLKMLPKSPREASLEEAARGALVSESPDLSLQDRVRVILALREELGASARASERVLCSVNVATADGSQGPLFVASLPRKGLPASVQIQVCRHIVDIEALAKEWGLSKGDVLQALARLGVEVVDAPSLENHLTARFRTLWPGLGQADRLSVLSYLAQDKSRVNCLASICTDLPVVLCEDGQWRSRMEVIPPCWRHLRPPEALWKAAADPTKVTDETTQLWDAWSPWRTPEKLAGRVLSLFGELDAQARLAGLADLSRWLEKLHQQNPTEALVKEIRTTSWVPARLGNERRLARPDEVLVHAAGAILASLFLVADAPLGDLPRSLDELQFRQHVEPIPESIGMLVRCLSEASAETDQTWRKAYEEVARLLGQKPELKTHWLTWAAQLQVFRLFRTPDRRVRLWQLFRRRNEGQGDFGEVLFCLDQDSRLPDWADEVYQKLGVSESPDWAHLAGALAAFSGRTSAEADLYASLVRALRKLPKNAPKDSPKAAELCLLACDGTYRPLHSLVADDELGRPEALDPESRALVVDRPSESKHKLLQFLRDGNLADVSGMRDHAQARLLAEPVPGPSGPEAQQRIEPWKDWLELLREEGMVVREALSEVPGVRLELAPKRVASTHSLHVEYTLPDGRSVRTNPAHLGPLAVADANGTLYLRPDDPCWSELADADGPNRPDTRVQLEVARLLAGDDTPPSQLRQTLEEQVGGFLERPSNTLRILAERNRKTIRDLYRDQNANEEFTRLSDRYDRSARRADRDKLEAEMQRIVEAEFVARRADQIRGHGYDEHSVFAELVQNAEDAYLQGTRLGMEIPQPAWIRFQVLEVANAATLQVEHLGRPFNCWRHNDKKEPLFRYDVEGLLRSAGSFKPQARRDTGAPSIGRFGLGFKSVYLLTDQPTVHSHIYHFRIDCGCIPTEVPPPDDLEDKATRILLPLRSGQTPADFTTPERARLLAVFLRAIERIDFTQVPGDGLSVSTRICCEVPAGPDTVVQQVELSSAGADKPSTLRLVRVRSASGENPAQVALMLDESGMPMPWPWKEDSEADFFATLPLKARLGCGVAVSHQFDVESGRTHLRQDESNRQRFEETARRVRALVEHLVEVCRTGAETAEGAHSPCAILERFWGVWRWDRGDSELDALRQSLAEHLLKAAEDLPVAPTLDPDTLVPIGTTTELFVTNRLPLELVMKLTEVQVEVPVPGAGMVPMMRSRTLTHPFLQALSRLTARAKREPSGRLIKVGWPELGHAFQTGTWLADYPHFVGIMARSLEGNERRYVLEWLPTCRVSGASKRRGTVQALPKVFLSWKAPDLEFLPKDRVLLLDRGYDEDALRLLGEAGLNETVPREEIEVWLSEGLKTEDAINLLRYFVRSGRWRAVYYEARNAVRGKWILADGERLTPAVAHSRALLPRELLEDSGFKEWLDVQPGLRPYVAPNLDARKTLHDIYDWWAKEGRAYIDRHVARTYPGGRQPGFGSLESPGAHCEWLVLLLLGSLHTMGRTRPGQHRGFLEMCQNTGWLDIFARPDATAEEWLGVLDSYIDTKMEYGEYSYWMRQFISIYQISRYLPIYMEQVLETDRIPRSFELRQVFKAKSSHIFSGTGLAGPSLTSVLGYGQNFVIRELVRSGTLKNEHCYEHCYVPYKRVEDLLAYIRRFDQNHGGCNGSNFAFLKGVFGGDTTKASFNRAFDIPFQFIAEDDQLRRRFLGEVSIPDDDW